jgi:hypothetical protein
MQGIQRDEVASLSKKCSKARFVEWAWIPGEKICTKGRSVAAMENARQALYA